MIGEIDFSVNNFKVGPLDNIHNFCWTLAFPISLTRSSPPFPNPHSTPKIQLVVYGARQPVHMATRISGRGTCPYFLRERQLKTTVLSQMCDQHSY